MNQHININHHGQNENPPIFNVPNIIIFFLITLVGIHVLRDMMFSNEQNIEILINMAFIPKRYSFPIEGQGIVYFTTPITYSLLHAHYAHLASNGIWLAIFGSIVARRLGITRFIIFWILSSVAGSLFFALFNWGDNSPVIGASGVVSGLMGAAIRFAFPLGGGFMPKKAHFMPRQSFSDSFSNKTVIAYLGIWFFINLLPAFGYSDINQTGSIAWEAHIGGFLFGFLLFDFFDHKNWQ